MSSPDTHQHYHEIEATSHYEVGLMLGTLFGTQALQILEHMSRDPEWGEKVDASQPYLDFTQKYYPDLIQEVAGQAKSLNLSLAEMWALCLEEEVHYTKFTERCTTLVTNQGLLAAHTEDEDEVLADKVCLLKKKLNDFTSFLLYFYGTIGGNAQTINSHGYAYLGNTLANYSTKLGLPRTIVSRVMSETANPRQELAFLGTLPRRAGYSHTLVSQTGEVIHSEATIGHVPITSPEVPFVHSNHYLAPESLAQDATDNATASQERYKMGRAKLQPHMTVEEMKALLSDQSCGDHESIFNKRTLSKMVLDWQTSVVWFWLRRETEKGWISYDLDFIQK